jgi:exodeoxyribonuclease V alpha subunit
MVSSDLLAEVIVRKPDRLILIGDQAQLPPVGCGQPFHDIVHCLPSAVRTLTTCYRNSEAIFKASGLIRAGKMPAFREQTENEFWEISQTGGPEPTHEAILDIVRSGQVDFAQDIILCCRNGETAEQPCSVESMNLGIKAIVNPSKLGKRIEDGDRVICTKNCPDLDVWNGTTGSVKTFDADGSMWVHLDFPAVDVAKTLTSSETIYVDDVLIPRKQVIEWQLAYALTTHKSQGSQYRKVFFVCLLRDVAALLDRPMLYTAITRARKECHVMGESRAVWAAISKQEDKLTIIQELARQSKATEKV